MTTRKALNGTIAVAALFAAGTAFGAIRAATPTVWKGKPDSWQMQRHAEKMKQAAAGGVKVVFIGDSITNGWEQKGRGPEQLKKYFSEGDWKMLNLGYSADRTEHVLWRLDNGELDGYEAKCILLMIGTNNAGHSKKFSDEPPSDTILGIREILKKIRAKQPKAKVVLTAIFPRGANENDPLRLRNDVVNREIRKFCDGKTVFWCDFSDRFLDEKGDTNWIMKDRLHPGPQGYEIWYEEVKPYIEYALSDGKLPRPANRFSKVKTAAEKAEENLPETVRPDTRVGTALTGRGAWWLDRLLQKRNQIVASKGKIDVVFLGDSITHNWESKGKAQLAELAKTYSILDIGYGGDRTQHVIWRCQNGELDGYKAKCIMVMIGTNNAYPRNDPKDVVKGIRRILDVISEKQPQAKVLLLPIFVRGEGPQNVQRKANEEVNASIKSFADGEKVIWVDFNAKYLDAKGDTKWIMPDRVHPNADGYKIWTDAVLPYFNAASALPSAAHFRSRPAKCEVDSGVFARDAARDHEMVDRIVNGEIEVVGVGWSFPSNRVDWLFDASAKKGPYNPEWTWELNRMSFWTALARAYVRTGDEKYARAFAQQFSDWLKQTGGIPPERDYNVRGSPWRTIEEGIRLMGSWSVAFEAFRKSPAFTDDLLLAFVNSAHAQARHLIAHRTRGNWLLMEMTGAYFFALDFPEFEDSESIRREALRVFSQAIKEQVLPDGLHYELSPNYHQVFHSSLTRLYLRAKAFGLEHEIPKDFLDTLRLGTEGPLALVTPAFTHPNFNDTFTDPKASSLSAAAKLFPDRRDFLWLVTNGREGEPPKDETASRYLPYSGFAAMRTDWSPDATYLAFDVGPLGMGHWHQDKLSFVLWKGSECLVFDDGGGQYEASRRRSYGLSGYDHNIMLVDGLAQNRTGPKIASTPIDAGWRSTQDEDSAFGIYDQGFGPKHLKLATQRREITFDKKRDVFTICDMAESADGKEHDYTLLFQLDTTNVVVSADGRRVRAEYGAGKRYALEMEFSGDGGERAEAVTGRLKPSMAGWFVGREYLVPMVRPATTVFVRTPRAKTHRFKTVLRPLAHQ